MKKGNVLTEGLDIAIVRVIPPTRVEIHGVEKHCRDRQPWGGFTDEQACSCVGPCAYDAKRAK